MSHVPQELLMNVASFGLVPRRLEPEYISMEMDSIDRSFPWSAEFLREYLRSIHPLYNQFKDVFDALGEYIPASSYIRELSGAEALRRKDSISRLLDPSGQSLYSTFIRGSSILLIIVSDAESVRNRIVRETKTDRLTYSDENELYFTLPPGTHIVDTLNALYLGRQVRDERDLGYIGSINADYHTYIQLEYDGIALSENVDYPYLISTTKSNDQLVGLFRNYPQVMEMIRSLSENNRAIQNDRYVPTNADLIRAILKINPRYNLGQTLAWARRRQQIIHSYPTDRRLQLMYSLLTSGSKMDDVCMYANFNICGISFHVGEENDQEMSDTLREYLTLIGLDNNNAHVEDGLLTINIPTEQSGSQAVEAQLIRIDTDYGHDLLSPAILYEREILRDFLRARAITMYNPKPNNE